MPEVRKITSREVGLLGRFGFQWAKGNEFERVYYDKIKAIQPTEDGFLVEYTEKCEYACSLASVILVDIPSGVFASGEPKDLDSAWIFVYYSKIIDTFRDGSEKVRS
jgi:hypothetical protein